VRKELVNALPIGEPPKLSTSKMEAMGVLDSVNLTEIKATVARFQIHIDSKSVLPAWLGANL
jgi:hypothetical protein